MDSRQYSSFTDVLRGNINCEDELFGLSENSPVLVQDSPLDDEVATSKKKQHVVSASVMRKTSCL